MTFAVLADAQSRPLTHLALQGTENGPHGTCLQLAAAGLPPHSQLCPQLPVRP